MYVWWLRGVYRGAFSPKYRKFLKNKLGTMQQNESVLKMNLSTKLNSLFNLKKSHFMSLSKEILNLNPNKILKKGFAIIRNQRGEIIKKKIDLMNTSLFTAEFHDGKVKIETKK